MTVNLQQVEEFVRLEHGLAIVSVTRPDGTPVGSVVNAGILNHPSTGEPVAGFVIRGSSKKAAHLRHKPSASLVWRHSWSWVGIGGPAELIGPDDLHPEFGPEDVRLLLRQVFISAGGTHDDWDAYDEAVLAERRLAVLVTPGRLTGNPNV